MVKVSSEMLLCIEAEMINILLIYARDFKYYV